MVIRFQPLVSPMMHEVNCYVHYFFVPYRLLDDNWEDFITGGVDGDDVTALARWEPVSTAVGSLWDYFGFPTGVTPVGALPLAFPLKAYNLVFNEYYRDETLIDEVALTSNQLKKGLGKDYFTSALPWQQRGTAPSLPLSGTGSAVWNAANVIVGAGSDALTVSGAAGDPKLRVPGAISKTNILGFLNSNTFDFADATTFDVAELRLAFQIQKWMERNARAGVRYTEFLGAHFGVKPRMIGYRGRNILVVPRTRSLFLRFFKRLPRMRPVPRVTWLVMVLPLERRIARSIARKSSDASSVSCR